MYADKVKKELYDFYLTGDAERSKAFAEHCFSIMDSRYKEDMSVTALKLLQYDVITEEFTPVIFKTIPYYYETGVLTSLSDGTAWAKSLNFNQANGWATSKNKDVFVEQDSELFKLKCAHAKNILYLICGPYNDLKQHYNFNCRPFLEGGLKSVYEKAEAEIKNAKNGSEFVMNLFDRIYKIKLKLMGEFNVYNALAGATSAGLIGVKTDKIAKALNEIEQVEGRLECVYDKEFRVFVDYAHTPDGLEKSLKALKSSCKGRLVCVFGCGGNRDKGKRLEMGKISGEIADFTVITSDNPRYEEPMDIIFEIEKGMLFSSRNYVLIQERVQAIKYAIEMAEKDDVLLIAGKGSERYQEILGIKHVYNDKDTVNELIGRNT